MAFVNNFISLPTGKINLTPNKILNKYLIFYGAPENNCYYFLGSPLDSFAV